VGNSIVKADFYQENLIWNNSHQSCQTLHWDPTAQRHPGRKRNRI